MSGAVNEIEPTLEGLKTLWGGPATPAQPRPTTPEEAWALLTAEEQAEAMRLAPAFLKLCVRHSRRPLSLLSYLADKRWTLITPDPGT